MNPLRTLRGRLAGSMLCVFLLALSVSAAVDKMGGAGVALPPDDEAYQDALVLAGFGVPALLLIWLVALWSLKPLHRASREASKVGPRNPQARLTQTGLPAEIAPLVDAVNGALDRMAEGVAAERRFTENAAHELRTPLAVLSLRLQRAKHAQAGQDGMDWPAIDGDLAHMTRLVGQLLDLARKENAGLADTGGAPVNLSRVAREAASMILPIAEAQGRSLVLDLPDALPVRGNADDLRDAIRNLLENAIQHGAGPVTLGGRAEAESAVVTVADEGRGVPAARQDAVFSRFQKDPLSSGSGLGLAIVRQVARSHQGQVAFLAGPGCTAEFRMPSCAQ